MNQNKFFFDAGSFTTARGARDLYGNALRSALEYDSYGNNQQFDVVVLTAPVPLAGADAGLVIGQASVSASANSGAGTNGSFAFKGRILGGPSMSPHITLPDPCNLSLSTDVGSALKIINLHTTFMSAAGYSGPIPSVGETVRVSLQAGDFKFNMQYATFDKLMSAGDGNAVSNTMGDGCIGLISRFENFDIDNDLGEVSAALAGNFEEGPSGPGLEMAAVADYIAAIKPEVEARLGFTLLPQGKCGVPADFPGISAELKALYPVTDCMTAVIGDSAYGGQQRTTGHPVWIATLQQVHADAQQQSWWSTLTTANGAAPILYSRGYRSLEEQIFLRMKKCNAGNVDAIMMSGNPNCSPPVAPPGLSRHNLGLAIDYGGIMGARGKLSEPPSRWLRSRQRNTSPDGGNGTYFIKRYSAEEWHYSIDGH